MPKTFPMIQDKKLYRTAFALALFTIFYNIVEGIISTYLGFEDESLALFGFGTDSFIEVISGLGIAHMVLRIQKNPDSNRDNFSFSWFVTYFNQKIQAIFYGLY